MEFDDMDVKQGMVTKDSPSLPIAGKKNRKHLSFSQLKSPGTEEQKRQRLFSDVNHKDMAQF